MFFTPQELVDRIGLVERYLQGQEEHEGFARVQETWLREYLTILKGEYYKGEKYKKYTSIEEIRRMK